MNEPKMRQMIATHWKVLLQSMEALDRSQKRCITIELGQKDLNMEDSDALDALTSKFSRSADIYTQKVLNAILRIKRVDAPTFVDRMNACEKAGIISSAAEIIDIRDLRNEITHEYWMDQLREQQALTLEKIPLLDRNITATGEYIQHHL